MNTTTTKITEIINDTTSTVVGAVWCPISTYPNLIAVASKETKSGDGGFDSKTIQNHNNNNNGTKMNSGDLQLYTIPSSNSSSTITGEQLVPKLECTISLKDVVTLPTNQTTTHFTSITWTPYMGSSNNTERYPMGIIAGGMVDGTVHLFDPYSMMMKNTTTTTDDVVETKDSSNGSSLICIIPAATATTSSKITAMQFSPLSTHQLCIGTLNGQVTIIDCTSPIHPKCTNPAATSTSLSQLNQQQSSSGANIGASTTIAAEITSVAWNTAVPHIVATAAGDGVVTVWDIQSNTIWCEIRSESVGHAVSDIVWNPTQGLHLLTASGDDRNPVLRLWDLGTSTTVPLGTLIGHTAGIFRIAYCPHDDSLLLTVAKDNHTYLWDLRTFQPVAELPMDSKHPEPTTSVATTTTTAVFAQQHPAASGGGTYNANALFASGRPGLLEQKQMRYDIQWSPFQRGVALTCSLDKKVQIHTLLALATGSTGRPPAWMTRKSFVTCGFGSLLVSSCGVSTNVTPTTITIQSISEQPIFTETVHNFHANFTHYQDTSNMIEFCNIMQQNSISNEDRRIWGFMQILFAPNSRQEMIRHLGYDANEIATEVTKYTTSITTTSTLSDEISNGVTSMSLKNTDQVPIATNIALVKKALVVGNFEAAVDCCFNTRNYADALMLAACGGGELWTTTQQRYFDIMTSQHEYLSVVANIIHNQLDDIVSQSDLKNWCETLAILATYSQSEEFPNLCIMLGDRLQDAGDESSASLCYMCALNLERTVQYWLKQMDSKMNIDTTSDLLALHEFVAKATVFVAAVGPSAGITAGMEALYLKYAQALADCGLFAISTKYCYGTSQQSKILRDRLYRSRASQQCFAVLGGVAPEFPYIMVDIQQSRGQIYVQPVMVQNEPDITSNVESFQQNPIPLAIEQHGDVLAPGWIALQDPSSGNFYYANEATGETTWDMPKAIRQSPYSAPMPSQLDTGIDTSQRSQQPTTAGAASKQKPSIVSKYGDGFVSSASNPELASQYGNVGTSNPYGGNARPGPAAVQPLAKSPVSGNLNIDKLQLSNHHASIRDTLLGAADALKNTNLNVVEKKQLEEAEKGIAILVKKLAREDLSDSIVDQVFSLVNALSQHDFAASMTYQTTLANSEWRDQKDWLKGIKILIQLAIKKI